MNLQQYKQKLLRENPGFRKEYEKFDLLFEIRVLWLRFTSWLRGE